MWNRFRHFVGVGAAYSALVWLVYAQIEYAICSLLPLKYQEFALPVAHWRGTAILFGGYAAMGAVLGGLAGVVWMLLYGRKAPLEEHCVAAPAILANLIFVVVYLFWLGASGAWHESGWAPVAISLVLVFLHAQSLVSRPISRWRVMLAWPWVAPVLLFVPYKLHEYWQVYSQAAHSIVWAVIVGLAVLLLSRVWARVAVLAGPRFLPWQATLWLALAAALFSGSALLDRPLPPAPVSRTLPAADNRPNILLVIWDTARADRESLYGYERDTTPFLRAFSQQATLYRNAFAASDMTLSSSASLFTGLYASWHGAHFTAAAPYGQALDGRFQTTAEILRGQGYTTMAVVSNCSYLSRAYQLDQGFQLYDVRSPVGSHALDKQYYLRPLLLRILSPVVATAEFDRRFRRGDAITGDVLKLLDSAAGKTKPPFFMVANYMDAHLPYIPPPPYDTLYPGKDFEFTFNYLEKLRKEVVQFHRLPTHREAAHMRSQYDGAVAFMDAQARRLVDGLRRLGLYDSTMVIFTADHGEAFGKRNLMEHAVSVYQNQVHIPLLVKYPNQAKGDTVSIPVSGIDVMPTILEAAGIAPPRSLQGLSLRQPDPSRFIISESFRSGLLVKWHPRFDRVQRAIMKGSVKFIESTSGKNELYDLANDPLESKNLLQRDSDVASRMHGSLTAMLASVASDQRAKKVMNKQTMERLRSLGYIQ